MIIVQASISMTPRQVSQARMIVTTVQRIRSGNILHRQHRNATLAIVPVASATVMVSALTPTSAGGGAVARVLF
jgi:hypothetical protein